MNVPLLSVDLKRFDLRCVNFSVEAVRVWEDVIRLWQDSKLEFTVHIYLHSFLWFLFFLILFSLSLLSLSFIPLMLSFSNSLSETFLILSFQRMDISCFIEGDKEGVLAEVQLLSLRKDLVYCLGIGSVDFSNSFALFFCGLGILGVMRRHSALFKCHI